MPQLPLLPLPPPPPRTLWTHTTSTCPQLSSSAITLLGSQSHTSRNPLHLVVCLCIISGIIKSGCLIDWAPLLVSQARCSKLSLLHVLHVWLSLLALSCLLPILSQSPLHYSLQIFSSHNCRPSPQTAFIPREDAQKTFDSVYVLCVEPISRQPLPALSHMRQAERGTTQAGFTTTNNLHSDNKPLPTTGPHIQTHVTLLVSSLAPSPSL